MKDKHFNVGIYFLKIWLCFVVVTGHFWDASNAKGIFYIIKQLWYTAVPTFMTISFYYLYPKLCNLTGEFIKRRLFKIVWPQIGWAVIYWVVVYRNRPITDMILQMIFGHRLNRSMWFQFALIALTLLFFLIFSICNKNYITYILVGMLIMSLVLQFSGINYALISPLREFMGDDTMSAPIGRTIEAIPWAVMGMLLNKYNVVEKFKEKKVYSILLMAVAFVPVVLNKFIMPRGFGYSGVGLWFVATAAFLFFSSVLDIEVSERVNNIIKIIAKPTMGIYCCQGIVGAIFFPNSEFQGQEMGFCVILFIMCWVICTLLEKIPNKLVKYLVS